MFSVLSFNWLKMVTCANLANGSEFHSLDSGFQSLVGFRIPQAKIFRISESGFPYTGRHVEIPHIILLN